MNNEVFKFLKKDFVSDPFLTDRLFVSAFVKENNFTVRHNKLLKKYIIKQTEKEEFNNLNKFIKFTQEKKIDLTFENLIGLFEFVISPADRVITGAIYTPLYIREFIIKHTLKNLSSNINKYQIADISCGCGGFLYNIAKEIKDRTKLSYSLIFSKCIFGLDIQPYSITRTKLLLSLLALSHGEDIPQFNFQLYTGDALSFKWIKLLMNSLDLMLLLVIHHM